MKIEFAGPTQKETDYRVRPWEALDMTEENFCALARSVMVWVPHRPSEGVSASLSLSVGSWALWGMSYAPIKDHFGGEISQTRAGMAKAFLQIAKQHPQYRYLVMIDNDESVHPLAPLQLARWGAPVVSGIVPTLSEVGDLKVCITVRDAGGDARFPSLKYTKKLPARGLREVVSVGAGLLCIRKDVLEEIVAAGQVPFMIPQECRVSAFHTASMPTGEDISFCDQVRTLGHKIHVDFSVRASHDKLVTLEWPAEAVDHDLDAEDWQVDARDVFHRAVPP